MNKLATIITLLCISTMSISAQNSELELLIKKKSDDPNSKTERTHLLELKNHSSSVLNVNLTYANKECTDENNQSTLLNEFLDSDGQTKLNSLTIQPNQSIEFYVKIYRPNNTKLNTWNCMQFSAEASAQNLVSNAIIIKTFIPNPKDFN